MPEPDAATLEARIARALDGRRATIEELVRQAVDARLVELVDQELEAAIARLEHRTNGATSAPEVANAIGNFGSGHASSSPAAAGKVCRSCGLEKPPSEFEQHRRVCRPCRRERTRDAQVVAVSAVAHTAGLPPPANEAQARELCVSCRERPPLAGRRICQTCKTAREQPRERREPTAVGAQGGASDAPGRPADPEPAAAAAEHTAPGSAPAAPLDPAALTAQRLIGRVKRGGVTNTLTGRELERWLLVERLATVHAGGRLEATARGHAIAGALALA